MKFTLKTLVAAVAFAAAGHAMADIKPGNNASTSQNGEAVFYAYGTDSGGNFFSYAKDLGKAFDAFVTTPSYALTNLGTDSNWTSFTGTATTNPKYWGVFATQRLSNATTGPASANGFSLLTTLAANNTSNITSLTNAQFGNAYSNANNWIGALTSSSFGTGNVSNNISYFFPAGAGSTGIPIPNIGAYLGSDFSTSQVFPDATNVIGSSTAASFFDVSRGLGSASLGTATFSDIAATQVWRLEGDNLSYAPVPEPETYGMLLAGLMMIGAIARRRRV
jgi:hypothetical protein